SSVATPDQVKGSDFCRPAEANSARQKFALPSCPLLPFRLVDSRRTGSASADHPRADANIFCSAKRPVSICVVAACSVLPAGAFVGSESQPRHSAARARKVVKPVFLMNVIFV